MRTVRAPLRNPQRLTRLLPVLACAVALAACGGSGDGPPEQSGFARQVPDLNKYACEDWAKADPAARRAVIDKIQEFAGGNVTGDQGVRSRGNVLEDEQAYSLFENRCRPAYARGFLLYKLYTAAAAFAGRAP
jgi:hypothetical protein